MGGVCVWVCGGGGGGGSTLAELVKSPDSWVLCTHLKTIGSHQNDFCFFHKWFEYLLGFSYI